MQKSKKNKIIESSKPEYFQKQKMFSSLCGVHAINNLLGYQACSEKELNQICYSLSEKVINPHKHIFGGDYDANIIMIALQRLGYECQWLDSRNIDKILAQHQQQEGKRIGYIVNKRGKSSSLKRMFGISERHWIAAKYSDGQFYELDSQAEQKQATLIPSLDFYLRNQIENESHVFEVINQQKK